MHLAVTNASLGGRCSQTLAAEPKPAISLFVMNILVHQQIGEPREMAESLPGRHCLGLLSNKHVLSQSFQPAG